MEEVEAVAEVLHLSELLKVPEVAAEVRSEFWAAAEFFLRFQYAPAKRRSPFHRRRFFRDIARPTPAPPLSKSPTAPIFSDMPEPRQPTKIRNPPTFAKSFLKKEI